MGLSLRYVPLWLLRSRARNPPASLSIVQWCRLTQWLSITASASGLRPITAGKAVNANPSTIRAASMQISSTRSTFVLSRSTANTGRRPPQNRLRLKSHRNSVINIRCQTSIDAPVGTVNQLGGRHAPAVCAWQTEGRAPQPRRVHAAAIRSTKQAEFPQSQSDSQDHRNGRTGWPRAVQTTPPKIPRAPVIATPARNGNLEIVPGLIHRRAERGISLRFGSALAEIAHPWPNGP
jgi:hypothetical protein